MVKSKLFRNLKPGDRFRVGHGLGASARRTAVVTVTSVSETTPNHFTGKRQWVITGNYPWWWPGPIRAESGERTPLVERAYNE